MILNSVLWFHKRGPLKKPPLLINNFLKQEKCKNVLLALPVDDTLERRRTVSLEVSLFSLLLSLLRVTLGGTGAGMGGRGGLSDRTEMVERQISFTKLIIQRKCKGPCKIQTALQTLCSYLSHLRQGKVVPDRRLRE